MWVGGVLCPRSQLSQEAAEAYAVSTLEGAVMLQLHRRRQGSRARAIATPAFVFFLCTRAASQRHGRCHAPCDPRPS